MNAHARFSSKGQVVIPKDIRDRYAFGPGDLAEMVEMPEGVLLRKPASGKARTVEEGLARLRATVAYDDPWIDESQWAEGIEAHIREMWDGSRP